MHFHVIKIVQYFCDKEDGVVVDGFMRALLKEKWETLIIIQKVNEWNVGQENGGLLLVGVTVVLLLRKPISEA